MLFRSRARDGHLKGRGTTFRCRTSAFQARASGRGPTCLRNAQLAPISYHPIALTATASESAVDSTHPSQLGFEKKSLSAMASKSSSKGKASKAEEASADADSAGDEGRKFLRLVSIGNITAAEKCLLRDHADIIPG